MEEEKSVEISLPDSEKKEQDNQVETDTNPKLLFTMNLISLLIHFSNFLGLLILLLVNDDEFRQTKMPVIRILSKEENNIIQLSFDEVFDFRISILNIAYFFFASLSHLIIILNWNSWIRNEKEGYNHHRWVEYSITSTIMIVIIAFYAHIYDLNTLIVLIILNVTMILTGHLMEIANSLEDTMRYFWVGCILGTAEWVVIFINVALSDDVDSINIVLIVILFVLFCTFPLNAMLYYKKIWLWQRYDVLEVTYQIISFLTKSVLGWLSYGLLVNWDKNEIVFN